MIRPRSIYTRLLLFSLGGTLALGVCFTIIVHMNHRNNLVEEIERRGDILATGIAMSTQKALLTDNPARVKFIVDLYKKIDPDIVYVVITNGRGDIIYHTFDNGFPQDLGFFLSHHTKKSALIDTESGHVRNIPAPIFGGEAGMAFIGVSEERMRAHLVQNLRTTMSIVVVITIMGIVVIRQLSRSVTVPINRVIKAAEKFGAGDYSHRIRVYSNDETGRLAEAFNKMADELDRHQRQIIHTEKLAAIGRLSSGIAHEINNPLMGVQNACRFLKSDGGISPKSKEYLELIEDSLGKIEKIVRGLLVSSKRKEDPAAEFPVNSVVQRAAELAEHAAGLKQVKLHLEPGFGSVEVFGSPDRLQQVVLNLMLNAIDAAPEGTRVIVSTRWDDGTHFARISISDKGPGIQEEDLDHIFEPFFTTKDPGVGTGLGLFVCHQIVQEMNGRIEVQSEAGRGAVFHVLLPSAATHRKHEKPTHGNSSN